MFEYVSFISDEALCDICSREVLYKKNTYLNHRIQGPEGGCGVSDNI